MPRTLVHGINIAFLIAYVYVMPRLGFFTATAIYLVVHMTFLGVRPWYYIALVPAGVLAVLYTLFVLVLGVPLPRGVLV